METDRQVVFDEAEDDVGTDKDPGATDAGAAVHDDGALVVYGPQVANEAHQMLGAARDAMVRPASELQEPYQMGLTCLQDRRRVVVCAC